MTRGFLQSQDTTGPGDSLSSPAEARLLPQQEKPNPRAPVVGETEEPRAARLTRLVTDHLDFIWRLLRRLGLNRVLADDVTQEVFLVAVRRLDRIEPGRERTFLYGVALRATANARRGLRRRREVPEDPSFTATATEALPDEATDQRRRAACLDALLDEMPAKLRRVLILSDVLELDVGEIASLERIPAGTVASRLRRARQLFRKKAMREAARLAIGGERP